MRILCVVALWLLASPALAYAPTGNAIADTFLAAVERAGYPDARVESVAREGSATVLTGLAAGSAPGRTLEIGAVRLENPLVNADNDLVSDRIEYEGIAMTESGEPTASIARLTLEEARLTGTTGESDATDLLGDFQRLSLADLLARSKAGEAITIDALSLQIDDTQPGVAAGSIALEGVTIARSLLDEPAASELAALGYDGLDIDFAGTGEWEAATGRAVVEDLTFGVAGMGTLSLSAASNGLTAEAYEALRAGGTDFPSLLNVLGTISLSGLTLTVEDAGLTDRLIERLADGKPRATVVTQLVDALKEALALLGDPAFASEATNAVRTFLTTPGRLSLTATPANDVSALQIIGAAMLNPRLVPALLQLKIANP